MKIKHARKLAAVLLLLSTLNSQLSTAFAQGSLAPPGAPTPTMKSLAQIEPRTPISSAPFTISAPGSYYLTTNVTVSSGNAITVSANNVTLDLNGFTISSTQNPATTGAGILLGGSSAVANVTIVNGFISSGVTNNSSGVFGGSGFGHGIYYAGLFPFNAHVSRISVSGCLIDGIYLAANNTAVESCTVYSVGGTGIYADVVSDSAALYCGSYGVYGATANNCYGYALGAGTGVYVNTANNCYGYSSGTGTGVYAYTANTCEGYCNGNGTGVDGYNANNCFGYCNGSGDGVNGYIANNCYGGCNGSSGIGVNATVAHNCYGSGNGSGDGLDASTAENCYGYSSGVGYGIYGYIVMNCNGSSSGGYGLYASKTASGCYGSSTSYVGLYAFIANVCHGETSTGTALSTTHNVNSF